MFETAVLSPVRPSRAGVFTTLSVSGASSLAALSATTITASVAFRGTDVGTGSATALSLTTVGGTQAKVNDTTSADDFLTFTGGQNGSSSPTIGVDGNTNINLRIAAKGAANINFQTGANTTQSQATHTASATRFVTFTGSNGGAPALGSSAGALAIAPAGTVMCNFNGTNINVLPNTATPAGGTGNAGILFGSGLVGIIFGSGAPSASMPKGSLYIRTDGSGTADRLYVNTNGTTGWTNFVSAA